MMRKTSLLAIVCALVAFSSRAAASHGTIPQDPFPACAELAPTSPALLADEDDTLIEAGEDSASSFSFAASGLSAGALLTFETPRNAALRQLAESRASAFGVSSSFAASAAQVLDSTVPGWGESRLEHLIRHRYFSPELGRFLQTDPMGYADSMSLYQGFGNNPGCFTDPLGLQSKEESFVEAIDRVNREDADARVRMATQQERRTAGYWAGRAWTAISEGAGNAWARVTKPFRPAIDAYAKFRKEAPELAELAARTSLRHDIPVSPEQRETGTDIYADAGNRANGAMVAVGGTAARVGTEAGIAVLETEFGGRAVSGLAGRTTYVAGRYAPGVARGSQGLADVAGPWLRGTAGSAGRMPGQIARKLEGQAFATFDEFRTTFWKAVAVDPNLSAQFGKANLARMREGLAPIAPSSQHVGELRSYILHHQIPLNQGGGVYDMGSVLIVSPRYHKEVLEPGFHYGR